MMTRLQLSLKSSVCAMMPATSLNGNLWKDSTSPSCTPFAQADLSIFTPSGRCRGLLFVKLFSNCQMLYKALFRRFAW